jgi:hypothetical protein
MKDTNVVSQSSRSKFPPTSTDLCCPQTPSSYPDLRVQCKVDGTQIKKFAWTSDILRAADGVNGRAYYHRISADEVQKLMFSKPVRNRSIHLRSKPETAIHVKLMNLQVLTEDETPDTVSIDRLGTIEICFRRCIKDTVNTDVAGIEKGRRSVVEISETSKKGSLVGSITASVQRSTQPRRCNADQVCFQLHKTRGPETDSFITHKGIPSGRQRQRSFFVEASICPEGLLASSWIYAV